jgi:predicted transcriptional regulator
MRIVVHYNRLKAALTEKDIGGTSDSTKSDYLQETIRKEIEDTRKRLNKANKKIEMLQDDICELNKNLHEVTEKMELEQLQAAEQLREFHSEVCSEQASILERTKMIEDLEKMWKESKK